MHRDLHMSQHEMDSKTCLIKKTSTGDICFTFMGGVSKVSALCYSLVNLEREDVNMRG